MNRAEEISSLLNDYCSSFGVSYTRENFTLDDEDLFGLLQRSLGSSEGYLSSFVGGDIEVCRDEVIKEISGDSSYLYQAYDLLGLDDYNAEIKYMILRMIHSKMSICNTDNVFECYMQELKLADPNEVYVDAINYRWYPQELLKLIQLRNSVLTYAQGYYLLGVIDTGFDRGKTLKSVEELFKGMQICNYKYLSRKTFILKYRTLRKEIEQDCDYLSSSGVIKNGCFAGADGNIIKVSSGLSVVTNSSFF